MKATENRKLLAVLSIAHKYQPCNLEITMCKEEIFELEAKAAELDRREQGVCIQKADYSDCVCGNCYRESNDISVNYCSNCGTKLIFNKVGT